MKARRARRIIGAGALLAVSGCAMLSGLGDLEISKDASDGAIGHVDGSLSGNDGMGQGGDDRVDLPPDKDSGPFPFPFDGHFPFDSTAPDANQPDTGGPETGPAGAGVVQCSASLQCTDGKVCCYSAFFPVPSCATSTEGCFTGGSGLACDDDSDCPGQLCCITPDVTTYSVSSACKASCGAGSYHACATSDTCGNGATCKHVSLAPGPIKGCQ